MIKVIKFQLTYNKTYIFSRCCAQIYVGRNFVKLRNNLFDEKITLEILNYTYLFIILIN